MLPFFHFRPSLSQRQWQNYNLSVSRVEPPLPPRGRCRGMRWFKSLQSSASLHLFSFSFRFSQCQSLCFTHELIDVKEADLGVFPFCFVFYQPVLHSKKGNGYILVLGRSCVGCWRSLFCSNSTTLLSHLSPPGMRWLKSLQPLCLSSPLLFFVSFQSMPKLSLYPRTVWRERGWLGGVPVLFCFLPTSNVVVCSVV